MAVPEELRKMERPQLFTFDIFGTVLDWRRGLTEALARAGVEMTDGAFDKCVDVQGRLEQGPFLSYATIVARSLVEVFALDAVLAARIGETAGTWPLYPDARDGLGALLEIAPCAAITNSDRRHGEQVQEQLGFRLSAWFCAEEAQLYKPSAEMWRWVSKRTNQPLGATWWHVSAYADYDLETARALNLSTVFVDRPHARRGAADLSIGNLSELAERVSGMTQG